MSKPILEQIRDELRSCCVIDSEAEFCRDWLGKSECYLRTLRFINGEPSSDALTVCASKLNHYAQRLKHSAEQGHVDLASRFAQLASSCMSAVEQKALSKWQQLPAMTV